jgi:hypothetical protein
MKFILAFAAVASAQLRGSDDASLKPLTPSEVEYEFDVFQTNHGRKYSSEHERQARFLIFRENLDYIRSRNFEMRGELELAINEFADLSDSEYEAFYTGLDLPVDSFLEMPSDAVHFGDAPASLDWREKNCVNAIQNQGRCGSCWAFASVASLESAYCAAGQALVKLSEQHLVDCGGKTGNNGCNGGRMEKAFDYTSRNKGLCLESEYRSYAANVQQCKDTECTPRLPTSNYVKIPARQEDTMKEAIAKFGPITVAIAAGDKDFRFYKSGVMDGACSTRLSHAVVAAGYGTLNGKDFWLVRNSWGEAWGDKGYILMARNKGGAGQCGINLNAVYPVLKDQALDSIFSM